MSEEQGIALSGHKEQDSSNDVGKNSDTEGIMQRDNFVAITKALDLRRCIRRCINGTFKKGTKNAKVVSWQTQNDIIECLSEFVLPKIKDEIPDYYAIIAYQVTDRFSNKAILLLCLYYVRFCPKGFLFEDFKFCWYWPLSKYTQGVNLRSNFSH